MKEITRIVTVKITEVKKVSDDTEIMSKEEIEERLKSNIDCDDVQVINVQDFILDSED